MSLGTPDNGESERVGPTTCTINIYLLFFCSMYLPNDTF